MAAKQGQKRFITQGQLRQILPVSRQSLYRWRKSGLLPYSKIGGVIFYPQDAVRQLIADNYVPSRGELLAERGIEV